MIDIVPGCVTLQDEVPRTTAADWMADLRALPTWRQEHLKLYGKTIPFPRLVAWHGDPGCTYKYSGHVNQPEPWTVTLDRARARVAPTANAVLLNWYRDGRDSISAHSDDEADMVPEAPIVCLSLGAARTLVFRHKRDKRTVKVTLTNGSVLVMQGSCQRDWTHAIPKETSGGDRISLTFRTVEVRKESRE